MLGHLAVILLGLTIICCHGKTQGVCNESQTAYEGAYEKAKAFFTRQTQRE
jgi:hypothetical protein